MNNNILEINSSDILRGREIGSGGFGIVYGGKFKINNSLIAIKELKIENQLLNSQTKENFKKEINIMNKLKHPNIIKLIGITKISSSSSSSNSENENMILEYLIKSSLYYQLHEKNIKIPLWLQIKLSIDIMKGISYLHQLNPKIIHRDLKSHK